MMTLDFKGEQVLHTVDFSFMIIDCNKPALEILYFNKSDRHVWTLCDLQLLYTICSERIVFLLISWEMLLLFVPIYTCHLHNVWQFLAIFFYCEFT